MLKLNESQYIHFLIDPFLIVSSVFVIVLKLAEVTLASKPATVTNVITFHG